MVVRSGTDSASFFNFPRHCGIEDFRKFISIFRSHRLIFTTLDAINDSLNRFRRNFENTLHQIPFRYGLNAIATPNEVENFNFYQKKTSVKIILKHNFDHILLLVGKSTEKGDGFVCV